MADFPLWLAALLLPPLYAILAVLSALLGLLLGRGEAAKPARRRPGGRRRKRRFDLPLDQRLSSLPPAVNRPRQSGEGR